MLATCRGAFTGLQSLKIVSWVTHDSAPDAVHRSFTPVFQGLSALTSLTQLIMQRVPGVCILINSVCSLAGLEVLSMVGVEHDPDSMRELGSYLSIFTHLQRLELDIVPLGAAGKALGTRGLLFHSVYGMYSRGGAKESDSDEESIEDESERAREVAGMNSVLWLSLSGA